MIDKGDLKAFCGKNWKQMNCAKMPRQVEEYNAKFPNAECFSELELLPRLETPVSATRTV